MAKILIRKQFLIFVCLLPSLLLFEATATAQTLGSSLILADKEEDNSKKIPLILIHGIHGTERKNEENINTPTDYWEALLDYNPPGIGFRKEYVIYLFQYYSDEVAVLNLGIELGREIDGKIPDRPFVIVAHSMGGLVAKNFMARYRHRTGNWSGKLGGETALGLITLATLHHGTPGANNPDVLEKIFPPTYVEKKIRIPPNDWKLYYNAVNFTYWKGSSKFTELPPPSTKPNRKDLRWDNYDFKIDSDNNTELEQINQLFKQYSHKVIFYGGILSPRKPNVTEFFEIGFDKTFGKVIAKIPSRRLEAIDNPHEQLSFADGMLFYGLGQAFGNTDGMVPYKSALFCDSDTENFGSVRIPPNFICSSPYRVRRFEFGAGNATPVPPDRKTLSITRIPRGFDHKDMYEHSLVIEKVRKDLLDFAKLSKVKVPPVIPVIPEIPTLFLFDVSGSMLENDKIGQARNSSLIALREIQENKRLGRGDTSVSVWTFSGGCSPGAARQILPFTGNLAQAENTLSAGIPRPDGGTPLPQAVDKAKNQVSDYLNSRPQLDEGRVILLSDGQSTCGEIRPAGIYSQAKTITVKNIRFLTIGFDVPAGSAAERDLQYLASSSGGQYFPAQNQQQLSRAFEKTIRVYLPKVVSNASSEFENAANAIVNRDFETARRVLGEYVRNNQSDSFGYYNLAVSLEALSRYKGAAENYRKYLQFAPGAADRREIETRIGKLEQDYRDQIFYYRSLLQSDLEYLTAYYKRLFTLKNAELAAEFAGFVSEKRSFYAGLPDILEIKTSWLKRSSEELTDSLGRLNSRVNLPSFDRDAVSLLPLPISQLEELVERLDEYNAQNFR
ncbi:MAG: VWA domain-containing protein [Pyrinomonadaceae bacterium]